MAWLFARMAYVGGYVRTVASICERWHSRVACVWGIYEHGTTVYVYLCTSVRRAYKSTSVPAHLYV